MKTIVKILLIASVLFLTGYASTASVDAGGSFTLTVTADGTQPFTYQWKKNGGDITGATNVTYTKMAVTATDAANYSCQVTNSAGTTRSDGAAITVISKPPTNAVTAVTTASAPVKP